MTAARAALGAGLALALAASAAAQLYTDWDWTESPLYDAVADGDLEGVLAVGKVRKNPDWRDRRGATALMYAAGMGRVELAVELLRRGANVDATDKLGQTAFHYACGSMAGASFPTPETIRLLAASGARVDAVDRKGYGGLHFVVAAASTFPEGVEAALAAGVPPDLVSADGYSAAGMARAFGREELGELIESAGGAEVAPEQLTEPEAAAHAPPKELLEPPLAGVTLPVELRMWLPPEALDEGEQIELRLRLDRAGGGAEWPGCAAARAEFRDGWGDEVPPAVRVAGGARYGYYGEGLETGWHLDVEESWDGEPVRKSSRRQEDDELVPLCLIGAGTGDWAGTPTEAVHFRDAEEESDLVVVFFGSELTGEARAELEAELGYPAAAAEPGGLLVTINEAGIFPAVLE